MSKGKRPFLVKPSIYAACIELAKGNLAAGGLLCQLALLTEKGSLKDEKGVTGWVAVSSQQLRVLTAFTRHQHDGALKKLRTLELVDTRKRKLSRKSKAALIWLRLPDKTKSAIEEIMRRDPIPAFAEKSGENISDLADAKAGIISVETEILDKNVILQNENKSENVIGETTKESAQKCTQVHIGDVM